MPVRRCLACRRAVAKASLLRLVVSDGAVRVDPLAREPGRGAYLCGRPSCTEVALRRDAAALRRALRSTDGQITVEEGQVRSACEEHLRRTGGEGRHNSTDLEAPRSGSPREGLRAPRGE